MKVSLRIKDGIARYAVRVPGDLGEKNASYIVSTNNVEAKYSCNEDNKCDKSHPMSQHGNSTQEPCPYRKSLYGANAFEINDI